MSSFEIISDYSKASLKEIPPKILEMTNLKMLFLEKNLLTRLPEEFFYRLPNLMWLDLRNNHLEMLPKSIAHHDNLEHLLLTNNNIQRLPNELGLVPNLKALQLADNPLVYPPRKIIQEGTKSIKKYLREQYEISCANNTEKARAQEQERMKREKDNLERQQMMEMQEEKLIKVHEKEASDVSFDHSHRVSKENFYSATTRFGGTGSRDTNPSNLRIDKNNSKFFDPKGLTPTLRVKKLDFPNKKQQEEPLKIIHNLNKSESKVSLKSYFNTSGIKGNLDRIPENSLKEGWLNRLRILLNDQERILQQERNLKTLSTWRQKPAPSPKNVNECDLNCKRSEAPYATYPEYSKIPSRTELSAQLQTFLIESDLVQSRPSTRSGVNLDKLIDDLVEQLREMEVIYGDPNSPGNQIEQAGKQIQKIVDIHKKLLKLKSANDYM